ncbi:hypothetical protein [Mesorhizobium sp. B2-5-7]|uniref:hypothetical protein n=1 Tax=Mesorhizobium sp. B2-5-7 TaxID=2589923 RepID=UPI00112EB6A1|nr:hypothetical protein [Mesorhizobium sp. B2-5-7]TPK10408.1 hypothetical protein FJ543_23240 [Mesorhizobium sp. B2-5-7]
MSRRDTLSLDEFALAARKQAVRGDEDRGSDLVSTDPNSDRTSPDRSDLRQEARKALRRMKRERVKGQSCFVNVNLDRPTKRRLKLAAFHDDTTMQAIVEAAIVKYLDELGL